MRRTVTIGLSLVLMLGLTAAGRLLAQDDKKDALKAEGPQASEKKDALKEVPKKEATKEEAKESPKPEASKEDAKKDTSKTEASKEAASTEEALASIPPEVEAKLEAARRAVAEAIVAAQDAGLVETSIDPPPILDILITGRALDQRQLKKAVEKKDLEVGVSPEVFGAWFSGYGKTQGIVAQKNVRIIQPSKGLKQWYDQRSAMLNSHIDAVRTAKGGAAPKAAEEPKKEEPSKEATKAEEPKPKPEPKDAATKRDVPKEPQKEQPK